jgi:hypothetical protein
VPAIPPSSSCIEACLSPPPPLPRTVPMARMVFPPPPTLHTDIPCRRRIAKTLCRGWHDKMLQAPGDLATGHRSDRPTWRRGNPPPIFNEDSSRLSPPLPFLDHCSLHRCGLVVTAAIVRSRRPDPAGDGGGADAKEEGSLCPGQVADARHELHNVPKQRLGAQGKGDSAAATRCAPKTRFGLNCGCRVRAPRTRGCHRQITTPSQIPLFSILSLIGLSLHFLFSSLLPPPPHQFPPPPGLKTSSARLLSRFNARQAGVPERVQS